MIDPAILYEELGKNGVNFYAGVPDSLLKDFNAYVLDHVMVGKHVAVANEGAAIAAAVGHYLATGHMGLTYMQNSGLGNAINPLVSLADAKVCQVPVMMLIGWRGELGVQDEPQHIKQGEITLELLKALGIPYWVIDKATKNIEEIVAKAMKEASDSLSPVAMVARKGAFAAYSQTKTRELPIYELTREEIIENVIDRLSQSDAVVCTTGKASRELFEIRSRRGQNHDQDFLTVGSMGHASQIALGIALAQPERRVICLDGDGSVLMHMGSLSTIGLMAPNNFKHIVINNGVYDSVGGQPTAGFKVDFPSIALAGGYRWASRANEKSQLGGLLSNFLETPGLAFLEIRVKAGARSDLGRPTRSPAENKQSFMDFLGLDKDHASTERVYRNQHRQVV